MDVDLFIKRMPSVVKELIGREAFGNRRSINQEAIALLEEALVQRARTPLATRSQVKLLLEGYVESGAGHASNAASRAGAGLAAGTTHS